MGRASGARRARAGRPALRVRPALPALPPVRVGPVPRRWPWAAGAAVLGAAAGAGLVAVLRRVVGEDAPDAQEPDDLQAVIDLPADGLGEPGAAASPP